MSENYDKRKKEMESLSDNFDSTTNSLKKAISHRKVELFDYKLDNRLVIILCALLLFVEAFPVIAVRVFNNENIAYTPAILLFILIAGHIFNLIKDMITEKDTSKELLIVIGTEAAVIIVAVVLLILPNIVTPQTGALSKIVSVYWAAGIPVILATLLLAGHRTEAREVKGPHYLLINIALHIPFYALLLYYIYLAVQ